MIGLLMLIAMNEAGRFHRAQIIDSNALVWLRFDASRAHVAGEAGRETPRPFGKFQIERFWRFFKPK